MVEHFVGARSQRVRAAVVAEVGAVAEVDVGGPAERGEPEAEGRHPPSFSITSCSASAAARARTSGAALELRHHRRARGRPQAEHVRAVAAGRLGAARDVGHQLLVGGDAVVPERHERGIQPAQVAGDEPLAHPPAGRPRHAVGAGLQYQHVRRAGVHRVPDRDRAGERTVDVAPAVDRHGLTADPRHPGRGEQHLPQLVLRAHAGELPRPRAVDVERDAVERDRARDRPLVALGVDVGARVREHEPHVERGPAEQQPDRVDELPRRQHRVVHRRRRARDSRHERRGIQGTGRGADHEVEAARQPEPLQRRRHAGRDDAAHPAALEHHRDPVGVAADAGRGALAQARAQHVIDGVHASTGDPRRHEP